MNRKEARARLAYRRRLEATFKPESFAGLESALADAASEPQRQDMLWCLERRRRAIRHVARKKAQLGDALDSASLPVAGGTLVGFKLMIEAMQSPPESPWYVIGSMLAAVSWLLLKIQGLRLRTRAQALLSAIGD